LKGKWGTLFNPRKKDLKNGYFTIQKGFLIKFSKEKSYGIKEYRYGLSTTIKKQKKGDNVPSCSMVAKKALKTQK